MSVYVGIDVHRKRSQVAIVAEDGKVQLNKNTVNGRCRSAYLCAARHTHSRLATFSALTAQPFPSFR